MIAYIMETFELDFHQAYAYVQNRRFCVCPNDGFLNQLKVCGFFFAFFLSFFLSFFL